VCLSLFKDTPIQLLLQLIWLISMYIYNIFLCRLVFSDYCLLQLEFLKREWQDALVAVNLKFFLFTTGYSKECYSIKKMSLFLMKILPFGVFSSS
jgi:hypothetical protein